MMDYGKYIVVDTLDRELFISFPASIAHAEVATRLKLNAVSAGQLRIWPVEQGNLVAHDVGVVLGKSKVFIECFGESTTLGLSARPEEDAKLACVSLGIDLDDLYTTD